MVKCYSLFCTNILYILYPCKARVTSTLWAKIVCVPLLAVCLVFSQTSEEAMQLTTHVQDMAMDHCTEKMRRQLAPVAQASYAHGCSNSKNRNVLVLGGKGTKYN